MRARILFRDAQGRDGIVDLHNTGTTVFVGRGVECALRTDDAMVSRKHAQLFFRHGQWWIEDLGSSAGTHLNDVKVARHSLADNDVIRCGSLWLRYLVEGSADPVAPTPPSGDRPIVVVTHWSKAEKTAAQTRVGTWFVFTEAAAAPQGRLARLLAGVRKTSRREVLPLVDAVALDGVRISPPARDLVPLAALVADRDLYRAEEDTVHLVCAVPGCAKQTVVLTVSRQDAPVTVRNVQLDEEGLAIEPIAALLPGGYTARLAQQGGTALGRAISFTVAEYTLAPLSARLVEHRLDRAAGRLHFALEVESYQVPCDRSLRIALCEADRELAAGSFAPTRRGHYEASLAVGEAEGSLRLRLGVDGDPARVAEVAIPGSRAAERALTVIGELGREVLLSLMPEPGALPVRGAYLSEGDHLATPVFAGPAHAAKGILTLQADIESLVLVILDLATGKLEVVKAGDKPAGAELTVTPSPACTVFVGGYVGGEPFEGYASFLRPSALSVTVEAPATVAPRQAIRVRVAVKGAGKEVPVLLSVRDRRLTVTDDPQTSLAASIQRGVGDATAGMADAGITALALPPIPPPTFGYQRTMLAGGLSLPMGGPPPTGPGGPIPMRGGGPLAGPAAAAAAPGSPDLGFASMLHFGGPYRSDPSVVVGLTGPPPAPVRESFPEQLFFGVVPVTGSAELEVLAGESLGTFLIEAFALSGGDWAKADSTVAVDQRVRADLDLPAAVHEGDVVHGRLRAAAASGRARVSLTRDGEDVPLRVDAATAPSELATPAMLMFDVAPGRYAAVVEDLISGERDRVEVEVGRPGRFRSLVREVGLLQAGDSLTLESAGALSLRVLPGLDAPFQQLVEATADYSHLCCEQTGAKILSATVMWLTAEGPAATAKAESILVAGIAREARMWIRGRGFSMYPESGGVHTYYSPQVVRYLWSLRPLAAAPRLPRPLAAAIAHGLEMADDVARAFDLRPVPVRIMSAADAHAMARHAARPVREWLTATVDLEAREPRVRATQGAVADRATLAYAAAALLALGDLATGIKLANVVTRALGEDGRLYSTVDSVAAIALFGELARAGIGRGAGELRANGKSMSTEAASNLHDQLESIEVTAGVVPVEVTRIVEEDWSRFKGDLPLKVGFRDARGERVSRPAPGDRVELRVELPKGYVAGDLVHVALPACLSWLHGGGRVKRFSRDFEGKDQLVVPLVVTGELTGKQHFAVCVRNMFEEERAASPGLLTVGG